MRLNEFANPGDYPPTTTNAPIWSNCSADDLIPSLPAKSELPPINWTSRSDAPSIASHVGGDQLCGRRGAIQRSAA
jgi:hypothetical protein